MELRTTINIDCREPADRKFCEHYYSVLARRDRRIRCLRVGTRGRHDGRRKNRLAVILGSSGQCLGNFPQYSHVSRGSRVSTQRIYSAECPPTLTGMQILLDERWETCIYLLQVVLRPTGKVQESRGASPPQSGRQRAPHQTVVIDPLIELSSD